MFSKFFGKQKSDVVLFKVVSRRIECLRFISMWEYWEYSWHSKMSVFSNLVNNNKLSIWRTPRKKTWRHELKNLEIILFFKKFFRSQIGAKDKKIVWFYAVPTCTYGCKACALMKSFISPLVKYHHPATRPYSSNAEWAMVAVMSESFR